MPHTKSAFERVVHEAKKNIRELTPEQVALKREKGEKFHLIDVREPEEWGQGRAVGAVHISKGLLELEIEDEVSDPHGEIVVYCGGGSRSALAAESLQRMGYDRVFSMSGGFRAWKEQGRPVTHD